MKLSVSSCEIELINSVPMQGVCVLDVCDVVDEAHQKEPFARKVLIEVDSFTH